MNNKIIIAIVAGAVVVGGAIFAVSQRPSGTPAATPSPAPNTQNAQAAATITYSANGFSPATTTIKSGQSVTFKNTSSSEVQVDSDPHPIHTDNEDLNVGTIAPGQSKTVVLTKKGAFGFHNHLNPGNTAHITIQ